MTLFPGLSVDPSQLRDVYGAGGGSSKTGGSGSASTAPDTLYSTSTVKLIGLIGEGETGGVVGGLKGVYRNNTPIQNQDGTFNFKGITAEFRVGTPDQPYMEGFPGVQTEQQIGVVVRQSTPVVATLSDPSFDRVRVTVAVGSLFMQKTDGSMRNNIVEYEIEIQYYNGPWISQGRFNITGKTTSGYYRQHEFDLPKNPSGAAAPWNIRLTRITADDDNSNASQEKFTVQSTMSFYSITGLIDTKFTYPHSALIGLSATTSQLGDNVGEIRVLTDGILMLVPSNRTVDPVTNERTYSGIWDGTFKEEVADSPIWLLHNMVTNDRYGLGQFVDEAGIDKASFYEIGRYCDQLVPDGAGGMEPRHTFNGEITSQQEAYDLLQLIAQVYRGMVYWSSGSITSTQDRPGDVKLLVTESNVIDGELKYSSSAKKARHTVAMVSWHDPKNLYRENIEFVESSEGIALYGYNPVKIDLLGCTSRGQAHRAGLWTLYTEIYETQILSYRAGLDHAMARPGDIIAVQDPQISNLDLSGRLRSGSSTTTLYLDHNIILRSGVDYAVSVTLPSGVVQEKAIQSSSTDSSGRTVLVLADALTQTPDKAAVWQIAGNIVPQKFRIVSIKEDEPHIYSVTALQHEPSKFAAIDNGAAFEETEFSDFPNIVAAPTNLSVRSAVYMENLVPRQSLTLSWLPGAVFNSIGYYVTIVMPSGDIVSRPRTASTSIDILDAEAGHYRFIVVAVGLDGRTSLPSEISYDLGGWSTEAAATVTNLEVLGGGLVFNGRSATVTWKNVFTDGRDMIPLRNVVRVYDADTSSMVHVEVLALGQTQWTYDYNVNVNEGGPRRRFRVAVSAMTPGGSEGLQASIVVNNPPPELIVPTSSANSETLFISLPGVADNDHVGYLIWISEISGFNPLTFPYVDVVDRSYSVKATPNKTYYIRAAAYDAFSKNPAGLAISAEISQKVTLDLFDNSAPSIPQQPTLAGNVTETAVDGTTTARVTIAWPPVTSENLAFYELYVAEGSDPPDNAYVGGFTTKGTSVTVTRLMPGRVYSFKVTAVSTNGVQSGFSPVLIATAALNTTPPGLPTNFAVSASFEAANLTWTNPSNKDLLGIEVWGGTTNSLPAAVRLATAPYPGAFYRDQLAGQATKFYWIRAANTSGYYSDFVGPISATSPLLLAGQLQAGIIDETKIATSLATNKIVSSLPTSKVTEQVTLAGKVYKWDTATNTYIPLIQAVDIAGQIVSSQIGSVAAEKIQGSLPSTQIAGQLTADQIANQAITAAKFQTGLVPVEILAALPTTGNFEGRTVYLTTDKKTYRYNGTSFTADVAATNITGFVTSDQIAGLAAAKLTGKITETQITNGAITTPLLAASAVQSANIAAGAITTSKLAVVSANMAYNPDMAQGLRGWTVYNDGFGSQLAAPYIDTQWCPSGFKAAGIYAASTASAAAGKYFGFRQIGIKSDSGVVDYSVKGGVTYEFSAFISNHRCKALLYVDFVGASGVVGTSIASLAADAGGGPGGDPLTYPRIKLIAKAPAGATAAYIYFMGTEAVGDNPYIFVSGFMFAATKDGATETSPYVAPGITTIDGSGIITNSLNAAAITAGSITATQINVTETFRAGNAVIGAISAGVLVASAIKTDMIDAGAITGNKLAISTKNFAYNADYGQGQRGWSIPEQVAPGGSTAVFDGFNTDWGPAGLRVYGVRTSAIPSVSSGYFDIGSTIIGADGSEAQYPVNEGTALEASIYISSHRCTSRLVIGFFNSAGTYFGEFASNDVVETQSHVSWGIKDWNTLARLKAVFKVPTGAVRMRIRIRTFNFKTGQPNSAYTFVSGLMLAFAASSTQTVDQISPYVAPSVTSIDGGQIITRSITANNIAALSITSGEISAGAITASKLTLTDTSNSVTNGDFGGSATVGNFDGWTIVSGSISTAADDDPGGRHRLASAARDGAFSNYIACNPGDVIYASAMNNNPSSYAANIMVVFQTAGDEILQYAIAVTRPANNNSWLRMEGRATAPARANRYRILLQTDRPSFGANGTLCYWGKVQARRANSAEMIVDGSITTEKIRAKAIKADLIDTDAVIAAHIKAGAVGADEIAAKAISADKLGIGLNTGNLFWNSDQAILGSAQGINSNQTGASFDYRTDWKVQGTERSILIYATNATPNNYAYVDLNFPTIGGGWSPLLPVQGGQTYEFSAYVSAHRGQAYITAYTWNGSGYTAGAEGNRMLNNFANGAPSDSWRSKLKITTPADTTHILLRINYTYTSDGVNNDSYGFYSGFYFAQVVPGTPADVYSIYAPQSRTVISGGQISTNSIDATSIKSKSITTDQIKAGSINVDNIAATDSISADKLKANVLTADSIRVGNGNLTSLFNAQNSTTINGGAITANTISASRLYINNRPMTVVGCDFEMQVNGNGDKTGWLTWASGYISVIGDDGNQAGFSISAGSVYTGFAETHVWWNRGDSFLSAVQGGSNNPIGPQKTPMAVYTTGLGLSVLKGGTIIDGTRISTFSIKAVQIAANAIQADKISAKAITSDKIDTGAITADKLKVGTGGRNLFYGSDFLSTPIAGTPAGWGLLHSNGDDAAKLNWFGVNNLEPYNPPGIRSFRASWSGSPNSGQIADIYTGQPTNDGSSSYMPIIGSRRYEYSCWVSAHRCGATLIVNLYDRSGNYVGGASQTMGEFGAAWELNNWPRLGGFVDTPANAAYARFILRTNFNGQGDPYTFWCGLYFGEATSNQLDLSPWNVGGTTVIDGGAIRARSISADRITAVNLSTISADIGEVTAGRARSTDSKFVIDFNSKYIAIYD